MPTDKACRLQYKYATVVFVLCLIAGDALTLVAVYVSCQIWGIITETALQNQFDKSRTNKHYVRTIHVEPTRVFCQRIEFDLQSPFMSFFKSGKILKQLPAGFVLS